MTKEIESNIVSQKTEVDEFELELMKMRQKNYIYAVFATLTIGPTLLISGAKTRDNGQLLLGGILIFSGVKAVGIWKDSADEVKRLERKLNLNSNQIEL